MADSSQNVTYAYEVDAPGDGGKRCYLSPLPREKGFNLGLRPEAIIGEVSDPNNITPQSFKPNPAFVRFLSHVLAKHAGQCVALVEEAQRTQNGWVYVIDQRTATPDDAVPPEDIIGAFEVQDGKMVRFHGSPNHQLVSNRGIFRLHSFFQDRLIDELEALGPAQ